MKTLAILPELAAYAEVDAGATFEELAYGPRAVCFEADTIESAWKADVTAVRAFIADCVLGASEVRRNLTSDVFVTL
jgi:hypothetical protein